jgi:predicted DNA binding CopG/RHH family protein
LICFSTIRKLENVIINQIFHKRERIMDKKAKIVTPKLSRIALVAVRKLAAAKGMRFHTEHVNQVERITARDPITMAMGFCTTIPPASIRHMDKMFRRSAVVINPCAQYRKMTITNSDKIKVIPPEIATRIRQDRIELPSPNSCPPLLLLLSFTL